MSLFEQFIKPRLPEIGADEVMIPYLVGEKITQVSRTLIVNIVAAVMMLLALLIAAVTLILHPPLSYHQAAASSTAITRPLCVAVVYMIYSLLFCASPAMIVYQMLFSPNYIQISDKGIRLHWLLHKCWSSPWIPWDAVQSLTVDLRRPVGWASLAILEKHQLAGGVRNMKQMRAFQAEANKPRQALSVNYRVPAAQRGNFYFKISQLLSRFLKAEGGSIKNLFFVDAMLPADRATLIDACRRYAPDMMSPEAATLGGEQAVPQFTTLWLDQLERSQNEQKTLKPGVCLKGDKRRYEIADRIGSGGQAVAYRAWLHEENTDGDSGRDGAHAAPVAVILKEFVLPVSGGIEITEQAISNIRNEYELITSLDHPQIVACSDFFTSGRRAYLAMEPIGGQNLRRLIEKNGPIDEQRCLELALQMCEILAYLHGRIPPVVHRDFTPDNLMITEEGRLVLIDFNVAKRLEADNATTTAVGRHCYIPVEQFQGRASPQSDIYAMGCTLFYLLTGKEPEPITPSNVQSQRADVSDFLNGLVARATAKKESDRFKRAEELAQSINQEHKIDLRTKEKSPLYNTQAKQNQG